MYTLLGISVRKYRLYYVVSCWYFFPQLLFVLLSRRNRSRNTAHHSLHSEPATLKKHRLKLVTRSLNFKRRYSLPLPLLNLHSWYDSLNLLPRLKRFELTGNWCYCCSISNGSVLYFGLNLVYMQNLLEGVK